MTRALCRVSSRMLEPRSGANTPKTDECSGPFFKDYFNQPSRAEIGTMVAILEIGAFIASLSVGRIGDIIGRRKTILYGSMVFFIGGMLQTLANGISMMLFGGIISGLRVRGTSTILAGYSFR